MWTIRTVASELKVSPRALRRIWKQSGLPPLPRSRISLDQRVLVVAAMKLRDQGISFAEFNARREGLSRAQLFKIAGIEMPDDLLTQAPPTTNEPGQVQPVAPVTQTTAVLPSLPPTPGPRVWLRVPISDGVELHVAMGAVESRTLETIMAALRPITAG
jgi:hypothetical protein